jgi:hypothetical protein
MGIYHHYRTSPTMRHNGGVARSCSSFALTTWIFFCVGSAKFEQLRAVPPIMTHRYLITSILYARNYPPIRPVLPARHIDAGGLLRPKRVFIIMSGPSAIFNLNSVAEISLARPPKKPFWHPTGAVPISHTTTRALPTGPPTAAVHTRTVRWRPQAAGAERFLGMLPSVSQALLPSQTPNFAEKSPEKLPRGAWAAPRAGHGRRARPNQTLASPS